MDDSTHCAWPGCENTRINVRGLCHRDYQRARSSGSLDRFPVRPVAMKICKIDGCDRKVKALGLCGTHHARLRTTGTAGSAEILKRVRGVCSVEGCDSPHYSLTYCEPHYGRFKRHGDTDGRPRADRRGDANGNWTGDNASYNAVHFRLKSTRGSADLNTCDCGRRAAQWAYDHLDPNEKSSRLGAYSTDLSHYSAKCASCHVSFDRSARQPSP